MTRERIRHSWRPSNATWVEHTDKRGDTAYHTVSPEGYAFHVGHGNDDDEFVRGNHNEPTWKSLLANLDKMYIDRYRDVNVTGMDVMRNGVGYGDYEEDEEECDGMCVDCECDDDYDGCGGCDDDCDDCDYDENLVEKPRPTIRLVHLNGYNLSHFNGVDLSGVLAPHVSKDVQLMFKANTLSAFFRNAINSATYHTLEITWTDETHEWYSSSNAYVEDMIGVGAYSHTVHVKNVRRDE